jgi:hypothetical protein
MKKLIAVLMTVLFLGSTTGLVLAQATPGSAPVKTSHKTKKSKKVKKSKKSTTAPAASSTPAAK